MKGRRTPVADLVPRMSVDQVFLLAQADLRMTRTGKPYIKAELADRTGAVPAMLWDGAERAMARIEPGALVEARGIVETYQGALQVKLERLGPASSADVRPEDFLPTTPHDPAELERRLRDAVGTIENPHLRALLQAFLADDAFRERFRRSPAAKLYHHAYVGGLLEHVADLMELALAVVPRYAHVVDRDLVLAGLFFHDIGKIEELSVDAGFGYTDRGNLVGHITLGVEIMTSRAAGIEGFPPDLLMVLQHIILSHHGRQEWGSPVLPALPEAIMIHHLDNLDAKMQICRTALEAAATPAGNWTAPIRSLDGVRLYRRRRDAAPGAPGAPGA